jgi:hypothetical protein
MDTDKNKDTDLDKERGTDADMNMKKMTGTL